MRSSRGFSIPRTACEFDGSEINRIAELLKPKRPAPSLVKSGTKEIDPGYFLPTKALPMSHRGVNLVAGSQNRYRADSVGLLG